MASYGGEAAAGLVTRTAEVCGMVQMNPSPYSHLPSWNQLWSSTGPATVSWNHSKDNPNQNVVYYDPKRDVPLSGVSQTVPSIAPPMVQCTMGTTNVPHSYPSYSSSIPHVHSPVEYPNYYYNYRQTTNDSSVQQGVANQNSGAAYQPLSSFQNSGSYVGLSSNTYCNVSGHQTASGYGNNSYYYQNNAWNGGNSGNDHAQLYQRCSPDANAVQSSSSAPANPFSNQQLYNQRSYYYDHSVPNAGGLPNPISTTSDSRTTSICSSYSYPSGQPPPPGTTTSWKSDAGTSCPPPVQAPGNPVFQNQFADQAGVPRFQNNCGNQALGVPGFENQYVNQALAYPQNATNPNKLMLSNYADQQKTLHSQGSSSNISSVNHASEDVHPILQGAVTSDTCRVSKIQVSTNPRIAPGFSLAISKGEKKNSQTNSAMRPPYVSVSTTGNDVKATQDGPKAGMQVIITKATADGTLHMKSLDIEPLFPLLENAAITTETSTLKDSIPFLSTYRSSSRRAKSRWEPVVEEKFAEKVEVIDKESANDNIGSSLEETKRMGNSWDFRKFLQSRQAPLSPSQRPTQKQRTGGTAGLMENGNASGDSEREQYAMKYNASAVILANLPEEKKRREHRSKRFDKGRNASSKSRNFLQNKNEAANIYTRQAIPMLLSRRHEDVASLPLEDMDWDALTVKGTCQEIEQRFLRLTSAPDPATVRPEYVLEKALHMVKTAQKNYLYKCDQLKSIRQDLTVQRIHNELTVKVYETHACLALQAVDLAEYNQCQSQLKRLYAEGIKGCHLEFTAYNLLFVMLRSNNKRELLSSMASLSKEAKQDGAVKHALAVHAAVSSGNYVLFFKLYKTAPNLNACLMDLYVERMRFDAIKCMSKSYRPTVPVRYVAQVLGFLRIDVKSCGAEVADGSEVCEEWLKAHGAILSVDNNSGELQIDTKASTTTLYMPEPENAVAHGDASLAVDDFLTRAC